MITISEMEEMLKLTKIFEKKEINIKIYKRYIIAMLFYAFLSLKEEKYLNEELSEYDLSFEEAYENDEMKNSLEKKSLQKLGYFIKPEDSFKSIIKSIKEESFSLELLDNKIDNIKKSFCWKHPNRNENVFNLINFVNPLDKLSKEEESELISELLIIISENKSLDIHIRPFISRVYNQLEEIQKDYFYINSFHINQLLYKLIRCNGKIFEGVYDASCNLNRVGDLYPDENSFRRGFELNSLTCTCADDYDYSLVNMYPLMYDVEKDIDIYEKAEFKNKNEKYDLIISTCTGSNEIQNINYNNSIENMLLRLDDDGLMTLVLPTENIFNEASPVIRHMKNNVLDAIIKLPEFNNHNYSILIFKKGSVDTLLIDASYLPNFRLPETSFFKDDYDTFFYHPDIHKKFIDIIETYKKRREKENFSHIITNQELKNMESMENYNIIHIKEEDDSLNPNIKKLKKHRFPAPPRIMYPTIPLGSMGWRMGLGEDYLMRYEDYIDDKKLYSELFPRPITWAFIRNGDTGISQELNKFMRFSGGKYKFFTGDGKPSYNIDYNSENDFLKINDTEFDLKYQYTFRFASKDYTLQSFIDEEKSSLWGVNGKPLWDEVKYTLCLNANYSKIVSDKKLVDKLLETGDKVLIYFDDSQWGVQNSNGEIVGENLQGLALMQVRDEIRKVYENYDIIDWDISKYI